MDFELSESIYNAIDFFVASKFYTLFALLFGVGFYLHFQRKSATRRPEYKRRLLLLFCIGLLHSCLIWPGDVLVTYSVLGFCLLPFENASSFKLLLWSLIFFLTPFFIDIIVYSMISPVEPSTNFRSDAYVTYPDLAPTVLMNIFKMGSFSELICLNFHNLIWKYLGYIPSGGYFKFLGIFLFGAYLASINFFTRGPSGVFQFVFVFLLGLWSTWYSREVNGNQYMLPSTLGNSLYKLVSLIAQLSMSFSYLLGVRLLFSVKAARNLLTYLAPLGKMTLTNYLMQSVFLGLVFYNWGLGLMGEVSLVLALGIALLFVVLQTIFSKYWVERFKIGPFEYLLQRLMARNSTKFLLH